jgi:hypothetical protein
MALQFETGVFTKDNSGVGNAVDTVTLADSSITPVIVILYSNGRTGTGGANANFCMGFGVSDGTNEVACSMAVEDGVSTSNSIREHSQHGLVVSIIGSAAVQGDITDLAAGAFDVTWSQNPAGTGYEIGYIVIGGVDITNTAGGIGQHSNSTTVDATISFTPLAFQPDFMIWLEADSNAVPGTGNGGAMTIGMADSDGNQIALAVMDQDALATTKTGRQQSVSRCNLNVSWTKVGIRENEFSAFTATGWDWIQRLANASSRKFLYFACATGEQLKVVTGTTSTSATTKSYTTPGRPAGALLMGVNNVVTSGIADEAALTIGAMDGTSENSFLSVDDHNLGTSECGQSHQITGVHETTTGAVAAAGPTIDGLAVHDSFNATDFTLDWSDADSALREFGALVALGADGGGGVGMFHKIFDNDIF